MVRSAPERIGQERFMEKDGECRRMKRIRNDEFRIFNPCEEFQRPGVRNIPFRIGKRCEIVQGIQSGAELPGYLPCMFPNSGIIREIIYENIPFLGCYVRGNFLPALSVQQKNRIFHLFCRSADRKIPDYSYPCLLPHRYRIESLQFFRDESPVCGSDLRYCETGCIGDTPRVVGSEIEIERCILSVFTRRVPNLVASGNI